LRAFTWFRRSEVLVAFLVLFGGLALFFADTGHVGDLTVEERMQGFINDKRASLGIGRLVIGPFLVEYADMRARQMRNAGHIYHDWCFLCGEVVGSTSAGPWSIFVAWMRSDVHRHILMLPGIARLGCGAARDRKGNLYMACEVRY